MAEHFLAQGQTAAARQEAARAGYLGADASEVCLHKAIALLIEGRNQQALSLLEADSIADNPEARIYLAAACAKEGQLDKARQLADAVPAPLSAAPWFWYARAVLLAYLRRHPEAEADCQRALAQNPSFFPARLVLGQLYSQAGRLDEAEFCFGQVVEQSPAWPDGVQSLAALLYQRGKHPEALALLRRTFKAGVQTPALSEIAGLVLATQKRFQPALPIFEKLLNEPVQRENAVQNVVYCRYHLGQADDMLRFIESLSPKEQDLPLCNYHRAQVLLERQGAEAAFPYHRRFAEQCPGNVEGRCALIVSALYVAQKRGVDSIGVSAMIEALERDFPGSGHADLMGGRQALMNKDYQRALSHLTKAVQKMPDSADAHFFRGDAIRLALGLKASREMADEWRTAIKLSPSHWESWYYLAMWALERGDRARALDLVERAVKAGCDRRYFQKVIQKADAR